MNYSKESMAGLTESESGPKREIVWEIIPPEKLPPLLLNTLQDVVMQNMAAIHMRAQLIRQHHPTKQDKTNIQQIPQLMIELFGQLRTISRLLEQDPTSPIPIDTRYKDHPIIALDQVGISPNQ